MAAGFFSGHWAFAFGLLGNVVSFMVFLAPVPTFYQIYKKKSTEGFQSVPYVVGLFSAMLWIYYAFLKPNTTLLITINSVGVFIETIYIVMFLVYATKKAKMQTVKLIVLLIVCGYGFIILSTEFLVKKSAQRCNVVGWICLIFSLCVFVAPLGIMRKVIKTKSVEYMPFLLSLFLTLSAVMWFFYGLLLHDYYIAVPNVLGFAFGIIQMVLYGIYKNAKPLIAEKIPEELPKQVVLEEKKLPELNDQVIDIAKINAMLRAEKIPVIVSANCNDNNGVELPQNLPVECKA